MAKKRKTREQKQLADLRHTFRHILVSQVPPAEKLQTQSKAGISLSYRPNSQTTIATYPYLKKDLSKTAILTLIILASQIILFTLFKNHVLTIPGIGY